MHNGSCIGPFASAVGLRFAREARSASRREALQKSDLATKTLGNDAPDRPERASEKGPISSHLNETLADLAAASLRLRGWIDDRHRRAASPAYVAVAVVLERDEVERSGPANCSRKNSHRR